MIPTNSDTKRDDIFMPQTLPTAGYRKEIVNLLKENSSGLTIEDISQRIGTTRHTVSIILAELRGANLISIRQIGMAKLHNWRQES